ncbi:programmed cell death protein 2-like [Sigmodon hispidus]
MAAGRKPVLLGLRDAAIHGCPKGPAAWTASKLGGIPVSVAGACGEGIRREGAEEEESQRLSACSVLRTPCRPFPLRGRGVAAARSRWCSWCRCTARWKALRSTGFCTCSPVPAPAAMTAGHAGRRGCCRSRDWGEPGAGCDSMGLVFGGGALTASVSSRSWKVYRSQCLQVPEKEPRDPQKQGNSLAAENWCEGSQDWGSDSEETAPPPPSSSDLGSDSDGVRTVDWTAQLQALHLQDAAPGVAPLCPSGDRLTVHSEVPQFQPYYICVVEEDDYGNSVGLDHAHSLLWDYQQREGVDMEHLLSLCSGDGDEKYEKSNIRSGDQTFYKFMKRIAACQEQILRYSWSGEPLFLACPTSEISDIPACSGCGGQRTFEFQLMPALVSMLSSADLGLTVEFGTILIYTCEQSCWPLHQQAPMEEFCIIQEDPDEFLLK